MSGVSGWIANQSDEIGPDFRIVELLALALDGGLFAKIRAHERAAQQARGQFDLAGEIRTDGVEVCMRQRLGIGEQGIAANRLRCRRAHDVRAFDDIRDSGGFE